MITASNDSTRILLVDDDKDDCNFFQEALKETGLNATVRVINESTSILDKLSDGSGSLPNLIFLDLNMPKKAGLECLIEIRRIPLLKDIAIVIYSTTSSDRHIEDSFINGANVYLQKPGDFTSLKKVLAEVITINWQYQTSGLNRDNFLLSL